MIFKILVLFIVCIGLESINFDFYVRKWLRKAGF